MAVFKCKMCGGALEINNKDSVAICEYCGTKQTLPKLDDERKAALYDRANHFRRNNEFDKAASIYEQILSENNTDAESYWSLVLCRYGIEYVEDPKTRKRVPTVNRAQYSSIFVDEDYKSALHYADGYQSEIYEQEAAVIDEIQKRILEISQKEDPFDVFICYKETDNNGRRTPDSVYAQDIYKALTEEGYKVFFSRITLEDKLGSAYEPYIFAALNSAKVMLVVGTKAEHFNAVWVKNEWNRYLSLIKSGKKKTLIPIYQEISPYDLPEELSYIQAQDMSKIGFMQDLIHGIKKLIPLKKSTVSNDNVENQMVDSMLKKAFNFISSGDFKSATLCLDTVHAYDADNAMYYVGQLMIQHHCFAIERLSDIKTSIVGTALYVSAINSADDELKEILKSHGEHTIYNEALSISEEKTFVSDFKKALQLLDHIDSDALLISDSEFAKKVKVLREKLEKQLSDKEEDERKKAEELEASKQRRIAKLKKIKKISIISSSSIAAIALILSIIYFLILPANIYSKGIDAYENADFKIAIAHFSTIRGFKDTEEKLYQIEQTTLKYAEVGETVFYGRYNINADLTRSKYAPIEWIVVKRDMENVILIAKHCLTAMSYDSQTTNVDWKKCGLNNWLNSTFYDSAFSNNEKEYIITNSSLKSKVYIFDETEISQYLTTNELKIAKATDYAVSKGIQVADNGNSCWWIRKSDKNSKLYPVLSTGEVGDSLYAANDFVGVRPVIEVKIDLTGSEKTKITEEKNAQVYNEALDLYNKNNFEDALTKFEILGDYKDSKEMTLKSKYSVGNQLFENKEYIKAIEVYESIIDYADAKNKVAEAKYQYCSSTVTDPTDISKTYIRQLTDISYKDSKTLSQKMFAWKADVSIYVSLRLGMQTGVGFNAKLSGGDGNSTKIKFVISYDGETESYCDESFYKEGDTPSCQRTAIGDITQTNYTVKVYDGSGNLIGQASGLPKD